MILYKLIMLPLNLLIELMKLAEKLHDRNNGYFKYLFTELKDRLK